MNECVFLGRLTKDPDVRFLQSGKCVTSITLAVNRPYNKNEKQQKADFIPVIFWQALAETVGNNCKKGDRLLVKGRLQVRSYDYEGSTRYVSEIIAEKFEFIEYKKKDNTSGSDWGASTDPHFNPHKEFGDVVPPDEEIPF